MFTDFYWASELTEEEFKLVLNYFNAYLRVSQEMSIPNVFLLLIPLVQLLWRWSSGWDSLLLTNIGSSLLMDSAFCYLLGQVFLHGYTINSDLLSITILVITLLVVNIPIFRGFMTFVSLLMRKCNACFG